jgi:cupin fold WbuC family metalloprotein
MFQIITRQRLEALKIQAAASPKKRARIELHKDHGEVQEMIICLMRESYVRPHRHPVDKAESYHVIEGRLEAQIFSDAGKMEAQIILYDLSPLYRLEGGIYHAPVALSDFVIYHEVYPGPWSKESDVQYAPWAREESV